MTFISLIVRTIHKHTLRANYTLYYQMVRLIHHKYGLVVVCCLAVIWFIVYLFIPSLCTSVCRFRYAFLICDFLEFFDNVVYIYLFRIVK